MARKRLIHKHAYPGMFGIAAVSGDGATRWVYDPNRKPGERWVQRRFGMAPTCARQQFREAVEEATARSLAFRRIETNLQVSA